MRTVTLRGWTLSRLASAALGAGMATLAALTMRHFYAARFPSSLADAAACKADSFFSCANSALAPIAAFHGVPIGFFGFMLGGLVLLGAIVPSEGLERTNRALLVLGAFVALGLSTYSITALRSLCTTCTAFTLVTVACALLFTLVRPRDEATTRDDDAAAARRAFLPAFAHLLSFGAATLLGAWAASFYWDARVQARTGDAAARVVHQYFALDSVPAPSVLSPYWSTRSTTRFEDAPIHIVEFADLLCSDCRFFAQQIKRLAPEFPGQINVAFQFFPLDAKCNDVVAKDKHPGACDLAYVAAFRPDLFGRIHDEVFRTWPAAKKPEWRDQLARRYGVQAALADSATRGTVRRLIRTGAEYERTSEQFAHGIRSTPTLIINGRMIIGTLPDEQMRAIFRAIVDQRLGQGKRYIESWVE